MNSPGSARRAPRPMRAAQEHFKHHGRAVRGDLDKILRGVGVGRGKPQDDGFVDGGMFVCSVFIPVGVEDLGKAGMRMLQRTAKAHELRGDLGRTRPAEADDPDAAASGRRRDGHNGVGACLGLRHSPLQFSVAPWLLRGAGSWSPDTAGASR